MVMLKALAHADTAKSTLLIKGAKWEKVEVKGWPHGVSQTPSGALLLSSAAGSPAPSIPSMTPSGISFENPVKDGGGFDLEIQIEELASVFGNEQTLMIASRTAGVNRSITIQGVPGAQPGLDKCFTLVPINDDRRQSSPGEANAGKDLVLADGEIFSLSKETKLFALEDAVIGVPIKIVAGEPNIGSVVHCDDGAQMWANEGGGHSTLGVCIQIGLSAGKSVWLSKASEVVVSAPKGTIKSSMRFRIVEKT